MARRILNRKVLTTKEWLHIIKKCRYKSANTCNWGCLNSSGVLFTIVDFNRRTVPASVLNTLVADGCLVQAESGFYDYVPKRKNKRRCLSGKACK